MSKFEHPDKARPSLIRGHRPRHDRVTTRWLQSRDVNETCRQRETERPTGRAGAVSWQLGFEVALRLVEEAFAAGRLDVEGYFNARSFLNHSRPDES